MQGHHAARAASRDHHVPGGAREDAAALLAELDRIDAETRDAGLHLLQDWQDAILDPDFGRSAENLARYLALRERDLSAIQRRLAALGLSTLGRSEGHVAATLQAVRASLARIVGADGPDYPGPAAWTEGERILAQRKAMLFAASGGRPGIMVTMPTEAASDAALVRRFVAEGMTCARVNCAHDGPEAWAAIIGHVRAACAAEGAQCRILMDLGGPKCRIETVSPEHADRLHVGDRFRLLATPGEPGGLPWITISFPEVVGRLKAGAAVWINDGKIRCRVTERCPGGWILDIVGARAKGEKLKPEKGVNVPSVDLGLAPLSAEDLRDLDFVAAQADLIGFSFVQRPEDIAGLDRELAARVPDRPLPPLVLKIETAEAVRNLPRLIVQAAGRRPAAVMIARGDLAVDVGFGRMAELQEEILWLCQAASVPVIWATQVLDDLVREGLPTRAEATDAAMAQRAECVMLNKGPHLVEAIRFLSEVFARMDRHQVKKSARFGPLHSWPVAGQGSL